MNGLKPIKMPSAKEKVAAELRKAILSRQMKEGEILSLDSVASQLNVSAMPVREAFQILARDGLIQLRKNKGAVALGITETYIRENYMNEISMQDAARQFNYSDAYFCKLFKQCFDQNFTTYLTNFRINEAKRLLKDKTISVKDAGMKVGYYDSNYFAKVFKRVTGMIPSEYRETD